MIGMGTVTTDLLLYCPIEAQAMGIMVFCTVCTFLLFVVAWIDLVSTRALNSEWVAYHIYQARKRAMEKMMAEAEAMEAKAAAEAEWGGADEWSLD